MERDAGRRSPEAYGVNLTTEGVHVVRFQLCMALEDSNSRDNLRG